MKVLFESPAVVVRASAHSDKIIDLVFDLKNEPVNKINQQTINDLAKAVDVIGQQRNLNGLLICSAKDAFIVGADVTEFLGHFKKSDAELSSWLLRVHSILNRIEDFPFPSVALINGYSLGGGFEVALSATYRLAAEHAKVGLPETKLGIYPGWGGTIRLSRLIGADNAIEWISSGKEYSAAEALQFKAIDGFTKGESLYQAGVHLLEEIAQGHRPRWKERVTQKTNPLSLKSPVEAMMVFETAKGFVGQVAGPNYPAPLAAIQAMQLGAQLQRDQAIEHEVSGFIKMCRTSTAESLVTVFLTDQYVKKTSKRQAGATPAPKQVAVLGAGIMGGGIAYQSASKGVPIFMKDIKKEALELGLKEAKSLLTTALERGKTNPDKMAQTLQSIVPLLTFDEIKSSELVVEAVVENEKIKSSVLQEVESLVSATTVLASNTSTISINQLAQGLKRPENFCGMHFFNPVHKMPLVEIIRGQKTSEECISRVVSYALKMGKTPIVVNDCPGFLVNRVLFPYFAGFIQMVDEGVDFRTIDKAMEKFGWPMGPAYLLDVVGIDTAVHASAVMQKGFPERMNFGSEKSALKLLFEKGLLGQKSGRGFYSFQKDKKGKLVKAFNEDIFKILPQPKKEISEVDIIHRMMIPMIHEAALCLSEKIAASVQEIDLALIYGLGFPPFRGGIFKYLDHLGLESHIKTSAQFVALGALYQIPPIIEQYAKEKRSFYGGPA